MGNSTSTDSSDYSAPSKDFKEKMSQMGVNMPDLHREYNIPSKYGSYADLQSSFMSRVEKWHDGNMSDKKFYKWINKKSEQIVQLNPTLTDVYQRAANSDINYVKASDTRPQLADFIHGVASQYNEDDIDYYLDCHRTLSNNGEYSRTVDSKVKSISDDPMDLPEWVISQPTARVINQAIDRRVERALNPENFRNNRSTSAYLGR